ncbi:transporter substrate-binding domain-containing protein [Pseudomonas sp. 10B1]|uniref:substrate-binding periplasmic protein n=1 Tax=unclassified Pseudomonas TaxID=196821 RepID=UPI002AB40258|nr:MULTISPECIES: transporter substrate-binding domain-containing protein [unclassified Pseudomonas]MDY7561043.1 transporter substrate-binding domain-containing protein [Pseudomonas sp. AB6]MEA9977060.1 transporter substrate-binding domain-containing protein [Pseudomonas sp. RTS4]MEA9995028.1 transporter substrate-binding domain-containing protein [Pseudomonas sp. AA4]MEB0088747.1 transporter substrate-binding domain-containing protein [Pseudomonas sp. RTI1]MEB0126856.1 transporter substrate-bi
MRLLLSVLLLASCSSFAADAPLRFSIADSWSMPIVLIDGDKPRGGFLFDIMESLGRHMGLPTEYHVLARLRVQSALENGEVDIRCYAAQSWVPNMSGDYIWSLPLITQRDLLISTADNPTPVDPKQLAKESVGTVLGYVYPTLQTLFNSHQLVREDARSQDLVLQKLIAGRYRYAVANQWSMRWFNRSLAPDKQLREVAIIQEQPVGCVLRNDPSVPVQRILRTLLRMKMSGEIDQILERYGAPAPLAVRPVSESQSR